ncbi:MAG TPA: DUF5985 family protein [Caulobacteraceae bacterium]|jgi:hypothetical protein
MTAVEAPGVIASIAICVLCVATSAACAGLLGRAYVRSNGLSLLLWSAIGFGFFALNNLLLALDLLVFTSVDLSPWRQATAGLGLAAILYGFVWQTR